MPRLGYEQTEPRRQSGVWERIIPASGSYKKKVESNYGTLEIQIPRDRDGLYAPQMVFEGQPPAD